LLLLQQHIMIMIIMIVVVIVFTTVAMMDERDGRMFSSPSLCPLSVCGAGGVPVRAGEGGLVITHLWERQGTDHHSLHTTSLNDRADSSSPPPKTSPNRCMSSIFSLFHITKN
jgi:hypothetical protein